MSNALLVPRYVRPFEHGQALCLGINGSREIMNAGVRSTYSYLKAPVSGELGGEIWSSAGGRRLEYMAASSKLGAGDEEYPSPSLV